MWFHPVCFFPLIHSFLSEMESGCSIGLVFTSPQYLLVWNSVSLLSCFFFTLTILRNIGEVFWRTFPDMGLPNDSLTLNCDCRFSVWCYHRSEAFLTTLYQVNDIHITSLAKTIFIFCLRQSWPNFSTLNLNAGFEMQLITIISRFFPYFKVYILCLFDEYLLF